jgi:hypothetical protein
MFNEVSSMFTFHAKPLSESQQIFVEVICERLTREILVKSYREAQLFYTRTIGDSDTSAYNIAERTTYSFGLSPLFRNAKMIWRSWNVDLTNTNKTPQTLLHELLTASGSANFYSFKWILIESISKNIKSLSQNLPEGFSTIHIDPNTRYADFDSDNVGRTHAMADESARCIINEIVQRLDHFQTHSASIPSGQAKEIRSRFGSGNL